MLVFNFIVFPSFVFSLSLSLSLSLRLPSRYDFPSHRSQWWSEGLKLGTAFFRRSLIDRIPAVTFFRKCPVHPHSPLMCLFPLPVIRQR